MSQKDEHLTGQLAVVGLFFVTPAALALMLASVKLGAASIPIWIAASLAAWGISRGPIGEAIASRLRGDVSAIDLHGDLAELDDLRARLGELEERQDFSERLLARQGDGAAVEWHRE